jgi:hypothetical protein
MKDKPAPTSTWWIYKFFRIRRLEAQLEVKVTAELIVWLLIVTTRKELINTGW